MDEITDLENILPGTIMKNNTLLCYHLEPLTAGGDNYGSEILLLTAKLKNKSSNEVKEVKIVTKRPPDNEFIQKLFNTPLTFRKEVIFYHTVLPTLKQFELDNNVDDILSFFPSYFGGRLNSRNSTETIDKNAILLLENLKLIGYQNENRFVGFDLNTSKTILGCLAALHGVILAFKLRKPKEFSEIIMPVLEYPFVEKPLNEKGEKKLLEDIVNAALTVDSNLKDKAKNIYDKLKKSMDIRYNYSKPNELFATICHSDLWVNNIMIRRDGNGPMTCKFLDFQFTHYGSAAKDAIFFLFTSIRQNVLKENFDNLLEYYFENFVGVLRRFKCDTDLFSYALFLEELQRVLQEDEFYHIMVMLKPIFAVKEKVNEVKDIDENNLLSNEAESPLYKERVAFVLKELYQKGWI